MNNKPFFSIVIPTRNRAKLLPLALSSAINQTFGDFEIIISDNFSSDDTSQIAKDYNDKRIKYFRAEKSLSMGESWNFALSHAQGKYITFLSDDDAYAKIFLESIVEVINAENAEIVTCRLAPYFAVDTCEFGKKIRKNSLVVLPFSGRTHILDRERAVNLLFSRFNLTNFKNENSINPPQLVNTAYHHSLIKKVKKIVTNLFPIIASDFYTAALFLNVAEKYCYIDKPLYLHAVWEGSETGGSQTLFEKNPEERKLDYVPLKKFLSPTNYGANSVLRARADWGSDYYKIHFDYSLYFTSLYFELKYLQTNNVDVAIEMEEFEDVLDQQDEKLRDQVYSIISKKSLVKTRIKQLLKKTPLGEMALKFKNRNLKVLSDFNDIAQCGKQIDDDFLKKNVSL